MMAVVANLVVRRLVTAEITVTPVRVAKSTIIDSSVLEKFDRIL